MNSLTPNEMKTLKRIVEAGQMNYSSRMRERLTRLKDHGLIVFEEYSGKLVAEPTGKAYK